SVMSQGINEGNYPRQMSWFAIATPRGKAAQPPDALPESDTRSERVEGSQHRHALPTHDRYRRRGAQNQRARIHTAGLKQIETEDLAEVLGVIGPIVDHQQQLRPNHSGNDRDQAEIPGVLFVNA